MAIGQIVQRRDEKIDIRFWDITSRDAKSCLGTNEAATENQNLYPGIQTISEAAPPSTRGSSPDPSQRCKTPLPATVVCFQSRIRRTPGWFRGVATSGQNLQEAAVILRNPV